MFTEMKKSYLWYSNFAVLVIAFLLFINCNHDDAPQSAELLEAKITKIREYSILFDDTLNIGRLRPLFKTDEIGTKYAFLDEIFQRVLVSDSLGNVKYTIGRKGNGPKEFVKISGFEIDGNEDLVIYDGTQFIAKFFDKHGALVRSFEINPPNLAVTYDALITYKGRLFFGALERGYWSDFSTAGKSKNIVEYDYSGSFKDSFGNYDSLTNRIMDYEIFARISVDREKNRLYTVRTNGYVIEGWDITTKQRVQVINQKPNYFTYPNKEIRPDLPISEKKRRAIGATGASTLFVSKNYIYLYNQKVTEEWIFSTDRDFSKKNHHLAVYSKEGQLLAEIHLDHVLGNIVNDNLHVIENDNPDDYTIGVYALSLN